ncbi:MULTISPECIES: SoxR reducing system RseC family protein [Marinimicrobium]|jgi:sigma-E factor negative regulatory protein RseC|uniref:RseC/MucC-like positive regulator of sigma(E) n=1 Tax=Marinimicrobium koreense TaxID=306545 RepID=A0A3N1NLE8_9GAMM|nr:MULTISPECIES: SoxR reducing system RseC family protein [Marinimicrobium]ROQ20604.1 RseC/MucC-like positive regulator of sigma(E) [Marinimicrobium koreense]|tara:strand:+ start:539 stop:1000 length:462 start_codon:yes stop_codon:yes gene_type:complete
MISETGRIVAIETDGLWVETIQRSTCGSCAAEKGCGQSLMARLMGHTSYLWVLLEGRDPADYRIDQEIQIGVPESVVVNGSLFVYLTPLFGMLAGAGVAQQLWASDGLSAIGALVGLLAGGALVRWRAHQTRYDRRLQPVLLDDRQPVTLIPS